MAAGRRLRVHDPAEDIEDASDDVVDNILRKIREHGQDSLTAQERRILRRGQPRISEAATLGKGYWLSAVD